MSRSNRKLVSQASIFGFVFPDTNTFGSHNNKEGPALLRVFTFLMQKLCQTITRLIILSKERPRTPTKVFSKVGMCSPPRVREFEPNMKKEKVLPCYRIKMTHG